MTVSLYLIGIGTDGAVIAASDDGFHVRLEQTPNGDGLRTVIVTGPGYLEAENVHTPNIGLSRARDIIARRRRLAAT